MLSFNLLRKFQNEITFFNLDKAKVDPKIFLAFSGGPDSCFMLDLFIKSGFKVELAYVNHMLRDDVAKEEAFVKRTAEKYGVPLHMMQIDINHVSKREKFGIEEAARYARYKFFDFLPGLVATGHNLDDNVETFIFRLLRGSSINGLKGIPKERDKYIRPIINFAKSDILEYLKENNIEYFVDYTNLSSEFTRNFIRLDLFPLFEKINRQFKEKINNFIQDLAAIELDDDLQFMLDNGVSRESIKSLRKSKGGSFSVNISNKKVLKKVYNSLVVENVRDTLSIKPMVLKTGQQIDFGEKKISATVVDSIGVKEPNVFYSKYLEEFVVREKKNGDVFHPEGFVGTKKLKKFFIDNKISRFERSEVPIVCSGDEIVWIAGYRGSEKFKARDEDQKIVKLMLK